MPSLEIPSPETEHKEAQIAEVELITEPYHEELLEQKLTTPSVASTRATTSQRPSTKKRSSGSTTQLIKPNNPFGQFYPGGKRSSFSRGRTEPYQQPQGPRYQPGFTSPYSSQRPSKENSSLSGNPSQSEQGNYDYNQYWYEAEPKKVAPRVKPAEKVAEEAPTEEIPQKKKKQRTPKPATRDLAKKEAEPAKTSPEETHWFWRLIMAINKYIRDLFKP